MIPLAKPYTPEKLQFPCLVSRKFDGVPVKFCMWEGKVFNALSRQGKEVLSVDYIKKDLEEVFPEYTGEIVGEVTHTFKMDFKDVSGLVRSHTSDPNLVLNVFDCSGTGGYEDRIKQLRNHSKYTLMHSTGYTRIVSMSKVFNLNDLEYVMDWQRRQHPDWEGMIARYVNDPWQPGKRSWGYQKLIKDPTIELGVLGFTEAIDQYGEPKGMVGGLVCRYKGQLIGVGPGKLTHAERKELWNTNKGATGVFHTSEKGTVLYLWKDRVATVKYKADPSYDALRQPTFQNWRDDKEPDA